MTHPVIRYHGGKWRIAPWIISHFPDHRVYVEPFGGAASVLMRKPRSEVEVYNDLDDDIVNVFQVLRDPRKAKKLKRLIHYTPWSRTEFMRSYEKTRSPLERARRTILRAFMAHGTTHNRERKTGFRSKSWVQRQSPATGEWPFYEDRIDQYTERLRGVVIENRPAWAVLSQHDSPDTLFYVDPPYPKSVRRSLDDRGRNSTDRWSYQHEMTDEQHKALIFTLRVLEGMVVISGYPNALYDNYFKSWGWRREMRTTVADTGVDRTECLWLSPNIPAKQMELFGGA